MIALPAMAVFTAALSILTQPAHADGVNSGKAAAEQCVKFQKARSDKQIQACCADMLDGAGGKPALQQCLKEGKEMVKK